MKKVICLFSLLSVCLLSFSQVDNYAVKLDGQSNINFGEISSLNNQNVYTIQFWLCPQQWTKGAFIYKRGHDDKAFEATLGDNGTIVFQIGARSFPVTSDQIAENKWNQISVVVNDREIRSYINGQKLNQQNITTSFIIPEDDTDFSIGELFNGRIDEFRVWKAEVDDNYLLWDNTINKYHPNYTSLIVYYKFDQNLCPNIVDYTFQHHGTLKGAATREIVTDNDLFKYRIVSAYTEFSRFCDRGTDKAKYLLCNDLIALNIGTSADGSAQVSLPFNHGKLVNAEYVAEYEGRKGVLSLNGNGSRMDAGAKVMTSSNDYSFYTWLYIDEWLEGAYIFKREKNNKGISLRLGVESTKEIILRCNGNEYHYKNKLLVTKNWIHVGFSPTGNTTEADKTFIFGINDINRGRYAYKYPESIQSVSLDQHELADTEATIGENFNGKFDETVIWNARSDGSDIIAGMEPLNLPEFGKNIGVKYAFYPNSYWKYDKPEDPGYDYFSYKHYLAIMRSAYEGYRGYRIRLSASGHDGWQTTIANASKREKLGKAIADIINNDDELDGVDLDFEWIYNDPAGWENYAKVTRIIRENLKPGKILTITPHSVAYWFPTSYMDDIDYFLFQNYGPSRAMFTKERYIQSYQDFIRHGYPREKIVMSYATSTSRQHDKNGNQISPVVPPISYFQLPVIDPSVDEINGFYFTGFDQTRWRSEQVKEQKLGGIMCWTINSDFPDTENPLGLFRASAFAIASNVDTLVTKVDTPSVIDKAKTLNNNSLSLYPNPVKERINIILPENEEASLITVYNKIGIPVMNEKLKNKKGTLTCSLNSLTKGFYILKLKVRSGSQFTQSFIIN